MMGIVKKFFGTRKLRSLLNLDSVEYSQELLHR